VALNLKGRGTFYFEWMMIRKSVAFLKDVKSELSQVSWPSRQELLGSTKVVLVTLILLSLVIGFYDLICAKLIRWIIR